MSERTNLFAWLQDNARILLSIALVLFLLFAVYSYSKRTSVDNSTSLENDSVELAVDGDDDLTLDPSVYGGVDELDQDAMTDTNDTLVITQGESANDTHMNGNAIAPKTGANTVEKKDGKISVSAIAGNGMTHLARKAASEYITQEGVNLTAAQKIYVEDYLVRNTEAQAIHPGTTVSFENQAISDAIIGAGNMSPSLTKYFERCAAGAHL